MSKTSPAPKGPQSKGFNGLLAVLAIVLLLFVAFFVGRMYFGPEGLVTQDQKQAADTLGGPFTLTDQNGKTVSDTDFRGKYMLIYFGYTYCPDICPTALARNAEALALIGDLAEKVVPIFITIDPERDTQELLKSYVGHFDPRLIGLYGSPEETAKVAKEFRVYYTKVADEGSSIEDGTYLVDHTAITYLMGPDGKFLQHFSHAMSADDMAKRLREILGADSAKSG